MFQAEPLLLIGWSSFTFFALCGISTPPPAVEGCGNKYLGVQACLGPEGATMGTELPADAVRLHIGRGAS
jgi:hypothetical protein